MKKIILLVLFLSAFISPVFADSYLNLEQFLRGYISVVTQNVNIPDSYISITPKFTNLRVNSPLYKFLQKAIYLDIFPNAKIRLPLTKNITEFQATSIIRRAFPDIMTGDTQRFVSIDWLLEVLSSLQNKPIVVTVKPTTDFLTNSDIYQDVLYRLTSKYYYNSGLNQTGILHGAIEGMVNGLNDPYTAYFPPVEADQFEDQLQGQFFGIGAYVGMEQPGVFMITATIGSSPAQKAGLLAQDRILQVDDRVIDAEVSLTQAVQWIKGPSGTQVTLKILRDGTLFTVKVTRAKIVVPNIESKIYTDDKGNICEISLHLFDSGLARDFSKILGDMSHHRCDKYIFDLRNNPGGALNEVVDMLDYFVPTGAASVTVKSKTDEQTLFSRATPYSKLTGETIRILINKGSASASEIFAGVVHEYVPGALLVGTQSYGKGSVQDVIYYDDGSLLKYTVAKRYTGRKDTNIDGIGFTPDVKIEDNVGSGKDAVLDWALRN